MKKRVISGLTVFGILLCLAVLALSENRKMHGAEEQTSQSEKINTIGVVTKSGTSEYWMSVCSGMRTAAADLEVEVIILSPDSEVDEAVQEKMAETLIYREVDALAISPINSYDSPEYLNLAKEKGITVVAYDTGFDSEKIPYIGIDNVDAGYRLAESLAQKLGHAGEVGIVTGDLNQQGHRQRMDGFLSYMQQEPNMKVAFVESGYSNLRMSQEKIDKIRWEYPDVKGIMATSGVTALGIIEGMEQDSVKIVSVDTQIDALTAVKEGKISSLIAQSGYEIGYETIQYIVNLKNGQQEMLDKILEADLLTIQNVDSYIEDSQEEKWQEEGGIE